ncbi:MAG: aminotransferase class I/II-fold pyridoxal phosphate-dependent enzyme [Candidatus Margulisbacteria bacterium]|nr:aminotransferase class I/II-fold pyridoxal phosphate-dependent enzyme [Candidatus Margulisiibacteriota bacterium]
MNPLALELNEVIERTSKTVFSLLSHKGKQIYFPKKGILAQSADAASKKINATIGTAVEDDGSPMRLMSIAKEINISPAGAFPYAASYGRPDIREKWKTMLFEKNPSLAGKEVSQPVVTSALTHGLSMVSYMFVEPGDEVAVSDLCWDNYSLIFENASGGHIITYQLFKNGGFDMESMEKVCFNGKIGKKILLLNFPNNPAGYTPTTDEVQKIVAVIKKAADKGNKILVIIDDAYFGLVYEDGIEKESVFSYLADCHENVLAIKVDGPTKEDYVWGFRVGFLTFGIKGATKELYNVLEAKTAGAIRGNVSNCSNLSQSLLLAAYKSAEYENEKQQKYELLKSRYEAVKQTLKDNPQYQDYFEAIPFNSGYFMCLELKHGLDGEKVRQILLNDYDTGVIFISGVIRVAFSSVSKDKIPLLFGNIYEACKKAK